MLISVLIISVCFQTIAGFSKTGFKSRHSSSVVLKVSTLPSKTETPTVFSRLTGAALYFLEQPTRSRYAAAMALRFGYFLSQGVAMGARSSQGKNQGSGLDAEKVIGSLVTAITSDEIMTENSPIITNMASSKDKDFDVQNLFSKNFIAIISLLKRDLKNIEDGVYKFPYDLDPRLAPSQYTPSSVLRQFEAYRNDRVDVVERRARKGGRDVVDKYQSKKYPDYYLQNFHYQTGNCHYHILNISSYLFIDV